MSPQVWVLTGDKVETAVNIAYSCGHFKRFMTVLSLTSLHDLHQAESVLQMCWEVSEEEGSYGLVVDGGSLVLLMEHHKRDFYDLCCRCWSVVCCRMSPRQKAEMVRLVKTAKERPRCAAIGDGANDVSMIQEAHVGIGIMGKEGRQAVTCADFGISRFQFLQKVLLVHGHWSYVRVAVFIQFSFYKNVVFNTPMVFYAVWEPFTLNDIYWAYYRLFQSPSLNLACVLLVVVCLLPDLLLKIYVNSCDNERYPRKRRRRAFWRKIQELGLTTIYKDSEDVKLFCGMVDSLALLPLEDIPAGIDYLRDHTPEGLEPFLTYFYQIYVTVGWAQPPNYMAFHPVDQIIKESRSEPPRKRQKGDYKNLQTRMKTLCQDRQVGRKSFQEFVQGAGYNILWKS
ncbi:phospholipid-transporting ATPase IF-like 3 [Homarus americanus]|uniref:Phospholipid-transporting ATPase IF-like 3 n=1 Tax=Homarus americanus TaxID=6706 RepID=A0A8J5MRN0_HOMAM|nr:phospholipid-transporting ATPase IF-like 3 [Homarus americanus]